MINMGLLKVISYIFPLDRTIKYRLVLLGIHPMVAKANPVFTATLNAVAAKFPGKASSTWTLHDFSHQKKWPKWKWEVYVQNLA